LTHSFISHIFITCENKKK